MALPTKEEITQWGQAFEELVKKEKLREAEAELVCEILVQRKDTDTLTKLQKIMLLPARFWPGTLKSLCSDTQGECLCSAPLPQHAVFNKNGVATRLLWPSCIAGK
jgi:hypothetical protein